MAVLPRQRHDGNKLLGVTEERPGARALSFTVTHDGVQGHLAPRSCCQTLILVPGCSGGGGAARASHTPSASLATRTGGYWNTLVSTMNFHLTGAQLETEATIS